MFFRPTRSTEKDAFFYEIKVGILLVGGGIGLAGMLTGRSALVWVAIALLAAGVILRLIATRMNDNKKQH